MIMIIIIIIIIIIFITIIIIIIVVIIVIIIMSTRIIGRPIFLPPTYYYLTFHFYYPGLGFGLVESPSHGIIGEYFSKKYPTAVGFAQSFCAIGIIVFPLLFDVLLPAFGWRGTVLILGGFVAHICPASLFFRPLHKNTNNLSKKEIINSEGEATEQDSAATGICLRKTGLILFRYNVGFLAVCIIICLCGFGYNITLVYLPSVVRSRNLSNKIAYLMISLIGTGSFFGRVCTGFVVKEESKHFSARNWYVLTTVSSGILLLTTTFTTSIYGFITFALLFGWTSGLTWSLNSVLLRQYVGSEMFTNAFGYMKIFVGIGELTAPIFAGKYD